MADQGVGSIRDLLLHLPRRYQDRSLVVPISSLTALGAPVLLRARVHGVRVMRWRNRVRRSSGTRVEAVLEDSSGSIHAVWFNQPWVAQRLRDAAELYVYGTVRVSPQRRVQLVNPEISAAGDDQHSAEGIVPVYPRLGSLSSTVLRRLLPQALVAVSNLADPLPPDLVKRIGLPSLSDALRGLHNPCSPSKPEEVRQLVTALCDGSSSFHRRLAFDELLSLCCSMAAARSRRLSLPGKRCVVDDRLWRAAAGLVPFTLTASQWQVVKEIARDLQQDHPMARLVQGDVGSGKTVVAALALLIVLENGCQVALMAPTELLAEQHFHSLQRMFEPTAYEPQLLCASQPEGSRRLLLDQLRQGTARLVVGTHALFQDKVVFKDLGLVVVDEQHRFGVAQRQALLDKGTAPHLIVMTATPIPRSLALTLYGDLELSVITEQPPGRIPVRTVLRHSSAREKIFAFIKREVASGGRAYIVYPVIEASAATAAQALEENFDEVRRALAGISVGCLHSQLEQRVRERVYRQFCRGEVAVLLATTMVEVGVDVPEATVMVIESPQRFGLSQLHQLRGRVGRGARQSWCVLLLDEDVSDSARRRLEQFCLLDDGFALAEADLAARGAGELGGTRQWGPSQLRYAQLLRDHELLTKASSVAGEYAVRGQLEDIARGLARIYNLSLEIPVG